MSPPQRAAKAFLFIETQFDNLGDALINRELLRSMAAHAEVIVATARMPEDFKAMMGPEVFDHLVVDPASDRSRFLFGILARALRGERCFVFLSPGGWIGEIDGRLNLRSGLHTVLYHALSRAGVRICQLGVSYEDIGPKLRRLMRRRSGAIYRHLVRDAASRAHAESFGVRIDGLCPDLAFAAFDDRAPGPDAVTFSFRTDQYPGQIADIQAFVSQFMMVYGAARPVYFVAQVKKDLPGNIALAAWFAQTWRLTAACEDGTRTIAATEALYRRSRVVVSNRLHALLLAGSVGNAMIAAPIGDTNKKIRALFGDVGLAEAVFAPGEPEDAVRARITACLARGGFAGTVERAALSEAVTEMFR
jgi:polysaccharide pyruvyl transferase WcaK-like protein